MGRIFVVAWDYPPRMSGESVVCKRTLENSAFCYDVCCGEIPNDNDFSENSKIQVFPTLGRYIQWPFRVAAKFIELNKQRHYKVMMSRVMPPNGHFSGLLIKIIKPNIKWIVYFSDPIWNSPFISFCSLFRKNTQQQPNYVLMKFFGISAYLAIILGDFLVFNNERLARYVLGMRYKKYEHKIIISPYGHNGIEKHKTETDRSNSDHIKIAHIGQIYGARTFFRIVKALEFLKKRDFEQYKKIQIVQVGFICMKEKDMILNSSVSDRFNLVNEVSYIDSLEYMRQSEYVLILDPYFNDVKKNIYVPVKIYDYMSVGAKIIAIADYDSATADIIKQIGAPMANHNIEEIVKLLLDCISMKYTQNVENYEAFDCRQGIQRLDDKLAELFN